MRTLKFRVWGKGKSFTKGWINDTILLNPSGKWMWEHHHCMAVSPDHPNYKHQFDIDENEFVIEQYTGLKDKDGKEIYEGDIVTWPKEFPKEKKEVVWEVDTKLNGTNEGGFTYKDTFYDWHGMLYPEQCKIIGNIHEHQKLLKENKDE